jgi:hypothetical protein
MNTFLDPHPGNLLLVVAPHAGGALMLELLARLACRGPLRVLDGGNCFDVYRCNKAIAHLLGGQTAELPAVLERIQLARAFTCHQMETLLSETPVRPIPTLVLDLLSTFYDESVSADESRRLLQNCLLHLRRLNRLAPVAISARPDAPVILSARPETPASRPELLEMLRAAAARVWVLEPHVPPPPTKLL